MRVEETDSFSPSQLDFVPRERRSQSTRLVLAFIAAILIILAIGYIPSLNDPETTPIYSAVVILALALYAIVRYQQALDLVMTTEHQNLLFSQSMALGSSFCLLVRRNGTIVYADKGLRQLFALTAYSESQALESVFEKGGVKPADRERILGSIYNNLSDRLVFPINSTSGELKNYVLTVEPLGRPAGYLLIRGREYRGERTGVQLMPDMLRSTSADKLDHMLASTPIAHYATDAFGRLEYVNHALAEMLGYEIAEILDARLTLPQILYQLADKPMSIDYTLADFAGQAILQRRDRAMVDGLLFQTLIRDENGRITGSTGSVITSTMLEQSAA